MASRTAPSHAPKPSAKGARLHLERILGSATFQQVDRLKRFLQFIVTEQLEGRGDELKEYVVGVQVFGKDSSFDPRTDPIVRVQARRLRARLDRYYHTEGHADDLIIELPKGGYSPLIRQRETRPEVRRSLGMALASRNTIAVLTFLDNSVEGDLRHFCATFLLEKFRAAGEDGSYDVATQLGHTDEGELVRELYGHPDDDLALGRLKRLFKEPDVRPLRRVEDQGEEATG